MIVLLIVDTKIRVRYKETDKMGVVHHSNYYVWFEIGRTEYMRQQGLDYRQAEEKGFMLPLTETHCEYKQGAKYDDVVIIRTRMTSFSGVRITMEYDVVRERDQALLARGKTVHAITDESLRPVNIRKASPEIYNLFLVCINHQSNS